MKYIYLDVNSSSPPLIEAQQIFIKYMKKYGNPSSTHYLGRQRKHELDTARTDISKILNCKANNLIFTSGASESNRFLSDAIIQKAYTTKKKLQITISPFEHKSLLKPIMNAANNNIIKLNILKLKNYNILINKKLIYKSDIICITQAHNETGIITPWLEIIQSCKDNAILISDASQSLDKTDNLPNRIDAVVISGHKIGAFPGIGALILKNQAHNLNPTWHGGAQEHGLRPGTEPIALIKSFAAVIKNINKIRQKYNKIRSLRNKIEQALIQAWPNSCIIGKLENRLPNTSAITIKNINGDALRIAIDAQNICVGFGSACSSLSPEPNYALMKMGFTNKESKSTLRISLHYKISKNDILTAIKKLKSIKLIF